MITHGVTMSTTCGFFNTINPAISSPAGDNSHSQAGYNTEEYKLRHFARNTGVQIVLKT